ncbi:hypothetical protein DXG01_016487 [Tephrocybe rancida]|nr:hypothetical protein DXG01_016487 [Tephrocybe rancida]
MSASGASKAESNWDQTVDQYPPLIQQRAVTPIVKGHDVIVQSYSGIDLSALLAISALQKVWNASLGTIPTESTCNVRDDTAKLQHGQIVICTPGRVYDMMKRRVLNPEKIRFFWVDEADEILSRGFRDHLHDVFHLLPQELQVVFSSATIHADVLEITQTFMHDPVRIFKEDSPSLHGIKQYYVAVEREEWKLDTVCDLFESLAVACAIIFCNTRRKVDWLNEKMHARDFTVSALHADMEQKQREVLVKEFREGNSRILITTDVLARGLDVRGISPPVINYDLPTNKENYVHRVTRGNLGRSAIAINFVTTDDVRSLRDIEQFYNTRIDEMPLNVADLL